MDIKRRFHAAKLLRAYDHLDSVAKAFRKTMLGEDNFSSRLDNEFYNFIKVEAMQDNAFDFQITVGPNRVFAHFECHQNDLDHQYILTGNYLFYLYNNNPVRKDIFISNPIFELKILEDNSFICGTDRFPAWSHNDEVFKRREVVLTYVIEAIHTARLKQ